MSQDVLLVHPQAENAERPHAARSASQLKSLALCPGFKPDRKPKKEQHWVTQQGIRGHHALEVGDMSELQSDHEVKLAQMCEDYCATLPPAREVVKEPMIPTIEERWGYADQLRFREQICSLTNLWVVDLIDYKFVKVKAPEDAEINLQGMDYVVGIFDKYQYVGTVHVHFLAPRFGTVTTATFYRSDLPRLKLEIFAILTQAKRTDKKRIAASLLRPHYETCRFCGFAARCKAIGKIADTVYQRYVAEGAATPLPEVPANVHASEATEPQVLGRLKTLSTVLKTWSAAVDHHTLSKALDEGIIASGFEIGFRKGKRRITLPLTLLTIGPKFGLDMSDIVESANLSAKKLEDAVMAKAPRGTKKHKKAEFLDALRDADAMDRGDEAPTLVRISNPDDQDENETEESNEN